MPVLVEHLPAHDHLAEQQRRTAAEGVTRPGIRNRLVLVGAFAIIAIVALAGLVIEMQRRATIDAFATATDNLGRGMAQQTTHALAAADRVLADLQASLAGAGDPAAIMAAMRIGRRCRSGSRADARRWRGSIARCVAGGCGRAAGEHHAAGGGGRRASA